MISEAPRERSKITLSRISESFFLAIKNIKKEFKKGFFQGLISLFFSLVSVIIIIFSLGVVGYIIYRMYLLF